MVRTYWFVPIFYEAIGVLDLQPSARSDYVEACRPLWMVPSHCTVWTRPGQRDREPRIREHEHWRQLEHP